MSLLRVHAQLTLQARHQPLVRVVRHQSHQLHPSLDLEEKRKEGKKKTERECSSHMFSKGRTQQEDNSSKHKERHWLHIHL